MSDLKNPAVERAGEEATYIVPARGAGVDNFDAAQAALTAVENASGGEVVLGPGLHDWTKVGGGGLSLSRDNAGTRGKVTIRGKGAIVRLSANVPRLTDFNKVADHDLFHDIEIRDLVVDANNVGGQHHVIAGTYKAGAATTRINLANLTFSNITVKNIFWDGAISPNHRLGIWLMITRSAAGTATDGAENYIKNILCEDLRFEGGNGGIGVNGNGPGVVDIRVRIDDITLRRCWHSTMNVPVAFFGSSNFHIGSRGYGGRGLIEDCYGYGSGDTGIETNALQSMTIRNAVIEDCWNIAFYFTNYNNPPDSATQRVVYENCDVRVAGDTGMVGTGWRYAQNLSVPLGTIDMKSCSYRREAAGITASNTYPGILVPITTQIKRINVEGFTYHIENFSHTSGAWTIRALDFNPSTVECLINLRDIEISVAGAVSGGATMLTDLINLTGLARINWEGIGLDVNVTGLAANALRGIDLGNAGSTTLRGRIADLKIRRFEDDTGPRGIVVRGTATLTIPDKLLIENCDFSYFSGSSDLEILTATGVENKNKLLVRDCTPNSTSTLIDGTVPSAANLAIPMQAEYIPVSGTTGITSIDILPKGRRITLLFTNATPGTVTDGGNLKLAGNFTPTTDDTLTLISDGTNWVETARSVN